MSKYTSIKISTGNTITVGQPIGVILNETQGTIEKDVKYTLQFKIINYSSVDALDYIYVGAQKLSSVNISQGTTVNTIDGNDMKLCSIEFIASSKIANPTIKIGRLLVNGDTVNTLLYELTDFQLERGYLSDYTANANDLQIVKTSLESKINQLADSIQFMVSKNDFDNLGDSVSTALGQIDITLGEISLKVEQSDIDKAKDEVRGDITSAVNSAKSEIKITTDLISQNVSNLTKTVSTKADGSTVTSLSDKVGSLQTSVNGISGKVSSIESTTTTMTQDITQVKQDAAKGINDAKTAIDKAALAQSAANTANTNAQNAQAVANTNKANIGTLQSEVSTVKSNIATLDIDVNGITQRVSSTESTISSHTAQINAVDGKIDTAKSEAITSAKNTLNTTIANYYTKTQTDSQINVAKDSITQSVSSTYETKTNVTNKISTAVDNIEIGGKNILRYSGNFKDTVNGYWMDNGGGLTFDNSITYNGYNTIKTTVGAGISGTWYKLETNIEYTYSALIRCNETFTGNYSVPLHYWAGTSNQNQGKISVIKTDVTYPTANVWKLIYITFKLTGDGDSFRPFIYWGSGTRVFNIAYMKLEKGNKPTDYTPSPEDVQSQIDTHTSEITATNNKVSSIQTDLSGITSRVSSVEDTTTSINGNVTNLQSRMSYAEQQIKSDAIISTVTSSTTYKNDLTGKVSTNQIISSINQTAEAVKIKANKIDLTGELDLQGRFKCWKSNSDKTGNYLNLDGAMMLGYNKTGGSYPVFASGLWTDENMGYVSVGYTRADATDENGCLYMSPTAGNQGGRLTFSRLKNSQYAHTTLYFQRDGAIDFYSGLRGLYENDDNYTYRFDAGLSAKSLRCNRLRSYDIYPRGNNVYDIGYTNGGCFNNIWGNNICTNQSHLYLGTTQTSGAWSTYGALAINSNSGYIFPAKYNGAFALGTTNNRFSSIYSINSVSVSSDSRLKTDIHYLDEPIDETVILDNRIERNMHITTEDMYNFIKDDLKLASYRYNANLERDITSVDYGFIAQDILYTKVGSEIVQLADKNDLNSELSYNQGNYINVLAGALQTAINKIDDLEKRLAKLEELISSK